MSDASSMTKGWKINLLLLAVLVAVASVLWWLDRQDTRRVQEEKSSRLVSTFSPNALVRVQWWRAANPQSPEAATLVLVPQEGSPGGRWQITAPEKRRTNEASVGRLLSILGETYDRKVADQVADPAQFGLDRPGAVLTVYDGSGRSLQLSVGRTAPASKKQYLQIGAGGPVVLLSTQSVAGLLQTPDDLRDKRLMAQIAPPTARRLELARASGQVTLERGPEKEPLWRFSSPVHDLASENRVDTWLQSLLQAQGSGFAPLSAETAFKESPPDWILRVESGTGEKESVRIQKAEGRLLAWREGEPDALVLEMYLAEELDKSVMEMIGLRPLGNQGTPMKLQISHQGKTLTSVKQDGQWPKPVWTGIEEVLIRDAWRGVPPKPHGEPWLLLMAFQGESQWVIPFWKEGESLFLAPPNRPVELELTHYQAKAFMESVQALFSGE